MAGLQVDSGQPPSDAADDDGGSDKSNLRPLHHYVSSKFNIDISAPNSVRALKYVIAVKEFLCGRAFCLKPAAWGRRGVCRQ